METFHWVVSIDSEKNPPFKLDGPFHSNFEAERFADEHISTDYEVIPLPTGNEDKATRMVRHKLVEKYGSSKVDRIRHSSG